MAVAFSLSFWEGPAEPAATATAPDTLGDSLSVSHPVGQGSIVLRDRTTVRKVSRSFVARKSVAGTSDEIEQWARGSMLTDETSSFTIQSSF